jgi:tellurite resistance protein TerC
MIALGVALLETFHWIIYLFGAFLIFTAIRMAFHKGGEVHPERNPLLRLVRRIFPVTHEYEHDHFVVRRVGHLLVTPLLLVLLVVETTDALFALDSIPAIFAITQNPFLIYTSNVFALLGLRSLYFVFAHAMGMFSYLKLGLAVVLTFVGVKMVLADIYHIPTVLSLAVTAVVLTAAIAASTIHHRRRWMRNRELETEASEVLGTKRHPADEAHYMKYQLSKGIMYANAPHT